MAQNSGIEWTEHTFNPWWGCTKVSGACRGCYALTGAKRLGYDIWGPLADRRFFGDHHWMQPALWNARAEANGVRARVFCASMSDVFEERAELDPVRTKLWSLIEATPHLDWLLLTKRPHLVTSMVGWSSGWPANAWIGTTVEDQACADKRLTHLTEIPAIGRFISAEPLPGTVGHFRVAGPGHRLGHSGRRERSQGRPVQPPLVPRLKGPMRRGGDPVLLQAVGRVGSRAGTPREEVPHPDRPRRRGWHTDVARRKDRGGEAAGRKAVGWPPAPAHSRPTRSARSSLEPCCRVSRRRTFRMIRQGWATPPRECGACLSTPREAPAPTNVSCGRS